MAFYQTCCQLPRRFRILLASFLQSESLAFAEVLPEAKIQQAFDEEDANFAQHEEDIYTPPLTMWAFLSQVLFKEEHRSCAAAVARVVVLFVALGKDPPADGTSAYCRARAKLSETVLQRLVRDVADGCEDQVPHAWLWHGRHVKLVDGSTVSMPDSEANQECYPQHGTQKKGLGLPIARLIVVLSLATAMVSDMAVGPYQGKETGETALFREVMSHLNPGEVVLADRYFCSYFMICLLIALKLDVVVRLHQKRTADFRRGRRLGKGDHLVVWTRPPRAA